MILLTTVSDLLQVVTSSAAAIDVHTSWIDNIDSSTISPGRTNTAISSATTTTIVGSPASTQQRNVRNIHVRNKDAVLPCIVTVKHYDGTTTVEMIKVPLAIGEELEFVTGHGWTVFDVNGACKTTGTTGAQGVQGVQGIQGFMIEGADGLDGSDSYVAGPPGSPGLQGIQGLPGMFTEGVDGSDGADSFVPGPPGASITGPQGIQGVAGMFTEGVDGSDGADSFVPGPPGSPGVAGTSVTGPAGIPGNDGQDGEDHFAMLNTISAQVDLARLNLTIPTPESVVLFGHSYLYDTICTYSQASGMGAILRSVMKCHADNWQNYCNAGARVSSDSAKHIGGWVSVFNNTRIRGTNSTKKVAPYTAGIGGLVFFCYGINDLGHDTNTSQERAAFIHAMRGCISRARASCVMDNTDASCAYGAGFTAVTALQDLSTMGTLRRATTTTSATVTITIPADYNGETIAIAFVGKAGVVGGTITFSGTAGFTGTLSTSNIKASGDATNCVVVKRGTAPVTGATQTIICTVSAIDASGNVDFDSWWIEAKYPPPVIVQNLARVTATGASFWTEWAAAQTVDSARDADIAQWNADLATLVAEFDTMVQIWDTDLALAKNVNNFSLVAPAQTHPNELGAARCVDTGIIALNKLAPAGGQGWTAAMNASAPSRGGLRVGFNAPNWYYTPLARISAALYTCVAGDMFAVPMQVTDGETRWDTVGFECTNAPTTGTTVRIGIYYNSGERPQRDYPGQLFHEIAAGIAVGTAAGLKSASISEEMDPGLYWLVMLINVAPTTVPTLRQIDGPVPGMPHLASTGLPISGVLGPVAWKLTGQPNAALKTVFPSGGVLVASAPYIGVRGAVPN